MGDLKKYLILTILTFFFLSGIFLYQQVKFNDGKLHVVFCDVGQGDAVFIRTPKGNDILIDAGPDDSVLTCLSNNMPFWDRDLELVVLSHPHADHLTGLLTIFKRYSVIFYATFPVENNKSSTYQQLQKVLKEKKIKQKSIKANDKFITSDKIALSIKWPPKTLSNKDFYFNSNESSLISLLSYANFSLLLTGDADKNEELEIARLIGLVDVLKVSHHGSKTGTSEELLKTLQPKLAVISVGKKNPYGHPSLITLEILKNLGIKTLRTDQNGEIEIVSDGKQWKVK